jgi:hypothetical protein
MENETAAEVAAFVGKTVIIGRKGPFAMAC